jgi:L-ascorbate metabolism protein UlaG (beta-lactamase superfamily)
MACDRPGVYRREHASLVIRSRTTSILVDPIAPFAELPNLARAPVDESTHDAVAITHGHSDHWCPPTILQRVAYPDIPVIVPRVPRSNVLTRPEFKRELQLLGQRVLDPPWNTEVTIGDIVIDILPFFGEQPTKDIALPVRDVRSWGNCYRFNTPDFSTLLLVDCGEDPEGSVVDVCRRSFLRRGPVDLVLACMREFASPFFTGLAQYWAAVPLGSLKELFERLERGDLPSTTAGTEGIARAVEASRARHFAPYANGFEGAGAPICDIGWGEGEPSEAEVSQTLRTHLDRTGHAAQVIRWNPGDAIEFSKREARVRRG